MTDAERQWSAAVNEHAVDVLGWALRGNDAAQLGTEAVDQGAGSPSTFPARTASNGVSSFG